jgi:hypothetical protein
MADSASIMGRPTEYKPEYCQLLLEHGSKGLSFEAFGGVVGVSKVTLYAWAKKYPDFLNAKNVARSNSRLTLETMMIQIASGRVKYGNATPIIYMLKSIHGLQEDMPLEEDDIEEIEFVE